MSVKGDKTRMDQLSRSDECYVRASPTRGVLGGIAEHTADVITLCEAGTIYGFEDLRRDNRVRWARAALHRAAGGSPRSALASSYKPLSGNSF